MRTLNPTGRIKADGNRAVACAGVLFPRVILPLGCLLVAGEAFAQPFSEHRDTRTGRVLFVVNQEAQPAAAHGAMKASIRKPATLPGFNRDELSTPAWSNEVAVAREFLSRHGRTFGGRELAQGLVPAGLFEPERDLVALRAERDQLGMTHVRFQQTVRIEGAMAAAWRQFETNGSVASGTAEAALLPVFGTELTVHLTAEDTVSSAGGSLVPDLVLNLDLPRLNRDTATALARARWQAQNTPEVIPGVTSARLCVLAPGLIHNTPDPTGYVVWEIALEDPRYCSRSLGTYYLDAQTGELREKLSGDRQLYREVYDCSYGMGTRNCILNFSSVDGYTYGRSEGKPPRGPTPAYPGENSTDVDTLYDLIPSVHQFYVDTFNRDGGNARGGLGDGKTVPWATTRAYTYAEFVERTVDSCAGYDFAIKAIWFCRGMVNPDSVGHEYAHAIDMFSHYDTTGNAIGTVYQGESGALNENQADLFGEAFARFYGGTTDWIFGASPYGRNLADPSGSPTVNGIGLPDRYRSERFYCGTNDHSGVHFNSTVSSKAAYLLSEGGRFNGCTLTGIGMDKVLQIWYRAVTQYYSTTETFNGAYVKLIQAAADLHGADSLEVRQVRRALQSVELDQPGFCSGQPARVPDALDLEGW